MNEISQKQLEANQENAKKGGVKTEEGKAVSKYNAVKHGILKETISEYEQDFYSEIIEELETQYEPVGPIEQMLLERIALYNLRLHRGAKAEKEYIKAILNPHQTKMVTDISDLLGESVREVVVKDGYVPKIGGATIQNLSEIYLRYETSLENRLYKALHEFLRLQATRKGHNPTIPIAIDINTDKGE